MGSGVLVFCPGELVETRCPCRFASKMNRRLMLRILLDVHHCGKEGYSRVFY